MCTRTDNTRLIRARAAAFAPTFAAAFVAALFAPIAGGQLAYEPAASDEGGETESQPGFYRQVARFDFDERPRGNYEDTPMYWVQLEGPGLPTLFARGGFDNSIGHGTPPSFRLDIQTRNVVYEYQHLDLTIVPHSDYLVTAYVRAEGLKYASAFVAAYFVDRFGEFIPGSQRISERIKATGEDPEPWQRVEMRLAGEFPTAYALRLQTWILQDHTWRERDPREVDPITRQDVYGAAWFDDIEIYLLPRVQLSLSNPAGLVLPGRTEQFVLEVSNATADALHAELTIADALGDIVHKRRLIVPARGGPGSAAQAESESYQDAALAADVSPSAPIVRTPVPELPPGSYSAALRLTGGGEALLERRVNFAVLPKLHGRTRRMPDNGIDVGQWRRSSVDGLRELLTTIGCGAVKVGIPMVGALDTTEKGEYFRELSQLLRALAEHRIDTTGVLLPPRSNGDNARSHSVRQLVGRNEDWRVFLNPILAHFGALLPTWQLGDEEIELRDGQSWGRDEIERVRVQLRRFMTIPRLAIPQRVTNAAPAGDDLASVWIPSDMPTRSLPRQLGFLVESDPASFWLHLSAGSRGGLNRRERAIDLARRIALAKTLRPGRVFVPAPFELSDSGGAPTWQPTADYLVVRTLYHYLAGKSAAAVMIPADDTLAIVFQGVDSSCMVIWSWRAAPPPRPVELYLGPNPRGVTIWGESVPLEIREHRTLLPVGPAPLIVVDLHAPLARLQASYRVAPTDVEAHNTDAGPLMTFRNPYNTRLTGEVRLASPGDWQVKPDVQSFDLAPGELFSQAISLGLPPRQLAHTHDLRVVLDLHAPEDTELSFSEPLTIGLRGVNLDSIAYWDGDDLVIEQSLRNLSGETLHFNAWCEPPGQARVEGEFLDIGPGESSAQKYVFSDARDLSGVNIPTGIEEINGKRSLIQFAEAPH